MKKLFYLYQRSMWYFNIFVEEARKPLRLWNEVALLMILLSTANIHLTVVQIGTAYIVIGILATAGGKLLVEWGIVQFNQKLGNSQNPELQEILSRIKSIEEKLK